MIGEIGGNAEVEAARWIKANCKKPVAGFIAGATAPAGRRMGHAGAIVGGAEDTAAAKIAVFKECGIEVAVTPSDMADALLRSRGRKAKGSSGVDARALRPYSENENDYENENDLWTVALVPDERER
jgi:succinyl-CoA synthetase alpha subunit